MLAVSAACGRHAERRGTAAAAADRPPPRRRQAAAVAVAVATTAAAPARLRSQPRHWQHPGHRQCLATAAGWPGRAAGTAAAARRRGATRPGAATYRAGGNGSSSEGEGPPRRPASPGGTQSYNGAVAGSGAAVDIAIEPGPVANSRCIWAGVDIEAPAEAVFAALTSYESLQTFIPGLAENRCLERRPDGCTLAQAGRQELGLGVAFSARVVLRIQEWPAGMPARLLARSPASSGGGGGSGSGGGPWWPFGGASAAIPGYFGGGLLGGGGGSNGGSSTASSGGATSSGSGSEGEEVSAGEWCRARWLRPRSPLGAGAPAMDISFDLVEGDFAAFKGLWRIQPFPPPGPRPGAPGQPAAAAAAAAAPSCRLSYSLFVRPQPWLPVHLVERRIRAEICANLAAVRAHVQGVARRRAPRPGPP